jgi:tetratricopeptide (TPR) repeat protein/tRNA A-37 threonylcarbamoyl transferase component Bud32
MPVPEPDDDSRQDELDEVLAEYMVRVDRGEFVDRARFIAEHSDFAEALRSYFEGSDDLQRMAAPGPTLRDSERTLFAWEREPVAGARVKPERHVRYFGDYELVEEIARGGMGVVYKARQVSLNRPVALKMIVDGRLASSVDVQRFRVEAEAAANLDHPNIVPIYEVGEHLGHHYFSMKLIEGGSLDRNAARLAGDQRVVARLVATIARTVHYAHQRGILHRDLKPANILIDAEGRPHLTDFGLARPIDESATLTSGGGIAGTPSYMAPEQAIGPRRALTTAADVYGIGAILYELLAGHPPFRGGSAVEIMWRVVERPPDGIRARHRTVHRDLETICLKCLEKAPERRYGSAEALAEDLERWLAHEPIRARRSTLRERLVKWVRREPKLAALTAVSAAAVGVAAAGLAVVLVVQAEANRELRTSRNRLAGVVDDLSRSNAREREARRSAQGRFDSAMQALRKLEEITKDAALLREPRLEGLRAKLLQVALGFYRELQASLEEDASPEARSQLSDAYARVAVVTWELGLQEEALAAYRRSLALVEQLAAAAPADPDVRTSLGRGHARLGFTFRTIGRPTEALQSYERAWAIQEPLARDNPANERYKEFLSWTFSNLGVIHLELAHTADAISFHGRAIAIHEALVSRDPGNTRYRSDLGWCWRYLSLATAASGDLSAARLLAEQAATLHEELVRIDPSDVEFRWRLARCLDEIGRISTQSGRTADAAEPLERAAEIYEALDRDNPVLYGVDLVRNRLFVASHRTLSGQPEEAVACIQRAEDLLKRSAQVSPEMLLYDLACAHSMWSVAGQDGGITPSEREARGRRAIAALRRAVTAGHRDLSHVRRDPVLDPLRSHPEFQLMMMDLEFPADPFSR